MASILGDSRWRVWLCQICKSVRGILNTVTFARDGAVQERRLIWHESYLTFYRYDFHPGDEKICKMMADGLTLMSSPTHTRREFE